MVVRIRYGWYEEIQTLVVILQGLRRFLPASMPIDVARREGEYGVTQCRVVESPPGHFGFESASPISNIRLDSTFSTIQT